MSKTVLTAAEETLAIRVMKMTKNQLKTEIYNIQTKKFPRARQLDALHNKDIVIADIVPEAKLRILRQELALKADQ